MTGMDDRHLWSVKEAASYLGIAPPPGRSGVLRPGDVQRCAWLPVGVVPAAVRSGGVSVQ